MLVVIEGPEKVGKTTLAEHLILGFKAHHGVDANYFHHPQGESNHHRIMTDLWYVHQHPERLVVMDRWWLSELVYRPHDFEVPTIPVDPWELERRYGGLADLMGVRILLQGDPKRLRAARTPDDKAIDPVHESEMYNMLAAPGWVRIPNYHLRPIANLIVEVQALVEAAWKARTPVF